MNKDKRLPFPKWLEEVKKDKVIPEDNTEGMIKIEDLIVGKTYEGEGRNFQEGEWRGDGFYGQRYKFGDVFETRELHWNADPHYGTFKPWRELK